MSANTKIEWADATVNWWAGCTAVSPACDNCYAKQMAGRLWGTQWGPGQPRTQFIGPADALRALDRKAKRLGLPLSVFHNSMSDFFDNEVPVQWRIKAVGAMLSTPNLIHLLLTKRIGNAASMLETAFRAVHVGREGWADNVPPNVWIGATIVNQEEADRDIPKLLNVPAAKLFLSMEPLLGAVNLHPWLCTYGDVEKPEQRMGPVCEASGAIDWVIVGGESGPGARPMHPDWPRSLRDQCQAAGVPFFFKQWGEWAECGSIPAFNARAVSKYGASRPCEGTHELSEALMDHVGKKAAGRLLDGRTWDEVPA